VIPQASLQDDDNILLKDQTPNPETVGQYNSTGYLGPATESATIHKRYGFLNGLLSNLPSVDKEKIPFANPVPPVHKKRVENLEDFQNFHKHVPMIEQDPRDQDPIIDMNEVFAAQIMEELRKEEKFKTLAT
jgi:hypothetical protein